MSGGIKSIPLWFPYFLSYCLIVQNLEIFKNRLKIQEIPFILSVKLLDKILLEDSECRLLYGHLRVSERFCPVSVSTLLGLYLRRRPSRHRPDRVSASTQVDPTVDPTVAQSLFPNRLLGPFSSRRIESLPGTSCVCESRRQGLTVGTNGPLSLLLVFHISAH